MKYTKRNNAYVVRLEKGDKITESLKEVARVNNIKAAMINGIGAATNIKIGIFNIKTNKYNETVFKDDNYEITNLTGNITSKNNEVYTHLHINFCGDDCTSYGGHLIDGEITITAEIMIFEIDGTLERHENEIGINIIDI